MIDMGDNREVSYIFQIVHKVNFILYSYVGFSNQSNPIPKIYVSPSGYNKVGQARLRTRQLPNLTKLRNLVNVGPIVK